MAKKKAKRSNKTTRSVEVAYLDPEKLALLKQLAEKTRILRSVLMREAVDDLLVKYGMMAKEEKPTQK
jgi:predicted transcriptional regulator